LRMYVPTMVFSYFEERVCAKPHLHLQRAGILALWGGSRYYWFRSWVQLVIGNSKIIRSLRRISWRWWKDTVQCVLSALCEPTRQECATGTYNMALLWGLHSADQLQRCSLKYVYNQQVSQNVSGGDEKASGESC
jgi:hypothetical protein